MKIFKHTVARIRNKDGKFEGIPALTGENIYQMAVRRGYAGSEDEYLEEIISDGWVTGLAEVNGKLDVILDGNGKVKRDGLVKEALYSPLASDDLIISSNHAGCTVRTNWNTETTYVFTQANSSLMEVGTEIAFLYWGVEEIEVLIQTEGIRIAIPGETDLRLDVTLKVPETFGMIAMKKIESSGAGDIWIVTGDAEVISS